MSNLNLDEFFDETFACSAMKHRWTIAGQGWAQWDCHGHRWAPVNVMTFGGVSQIVAKNLINRFNLTLLNLKIVSGWNVTSKIKKTEIKPQTVLDPCVPHYSLIVPGKDSAIGCDLCPKWFHSACANLSAVQIDVLTSILTCRWFCVACLPQFPRRIEKKIPLEPAVELHHLRKKISSFAISFDKNENVLKSPSSYAEKAEVFLNSKTTKFRWTRYQHEQTLFNNSDICGNVLTSSMH